MITGPQLRRQVEALFDVVPGRCTADEVVFICPTCAAAGNPDRTGNRSVSLKTSATNCWRCGKASRNFAKWCRSLGYEVDDEGAGEPDVSAVEEVMNATASKSMTPVISGCKLPRGFTLLTDAPNSVYSRLIGEMAEHKRLTWEDLERVRVGFTREDPTWEPYAIFPVFEWERVVYFQGRLYNPKPGEPTKRFPSRSSTPLGSRYWVYNNDSARVSNAVTVVVVESILNVLTLERKFAEEGIEGVVPVCVFKHAISTPQLSKLLALRSMREVCLFFDADATALAWEAAERLVGQRKITVAEMPELNGVETTDLNDDIEVGYEVFLNRKVAGAPSETLSKLVAKL